MKKKSKSGGTAARRRAMEKQIEAVKDRIRQKSERQNKKRRKTT